MTSMDCTRAGELLVARQHDELRAPERVAVEAHLSACDTCRETDAELEASVALLGHALAQQREGQRIVPPADLFDSVQAAIGAEQRRRALRGGGLALMAAAAMAIVWLSWIREPKVVLIAADVAAAEEIDARTLHQQHRDGTLQLDIESVDAAAIVAFVEQRGLSLEMRRHAGDIVPLGAAAADGTVLVALTIDGTPTSLVMRQRRADAVDEAWFDKEIHHRDVDGLKTLTWSRDGKSYVLVSELPGRGERACATCHSREVRL